MSGASFADLQEANARDANKEAARRSGLTLWEKFQESSAETKQAAGIIALVILIVMYCCLVHPKIQDSMTNGWSGKYRRMDETHAVEDARIVVRMSGPTLFVNQTAYHRKNPHHWASHDGMRELNMDSDTGYIIIRRVTSSVAAQYEPLM